MTPTVFFAVDILRFGNRKRSMVEGSNASGDTALSDGARTMSWNRSCKE